MNDLTMVTDETEFEPMSGESNPKPVTVQCPICGKVIDIPEHNSISRSDALKRHLEEEHKGNPGVEYVTRKVYLDKDGVALGTSEGEEAYYGDYYTSTDMYLPKTIKVTGKTYHQIMSELPVTTRPSNPGEPLHEPSPGFSNFHTLMLHAVAEMYEPGGIVVDEAKAKATSCECVEYKPDKFWCTSRGVVGALTDEQEGIYCNPREIVERPGIKERMARWQECVTKSREALPPTDGATRLEIYLTEMSKCLKDGGIEE